MQGGKVDGDRAPRNQDVAGAVDGDRADALPRLAAAEEGGEHQGGARGVELGEKSGAQVRDHVGRPRLRLKGRRGGEVARRRRAADEDVAGGIDGDPMGEVGRAASQVRRVEKRAAPRVDLAHDGMRQELCLAGETLLKGLDRGEIGRVGDAGDVEVAAFVLRHAGEVVGGAAAEKAREGQLGIDRQSAARMPAGMPAGSEKPNLVSAEEAVANRARGTAARGDRATLEEGAVRGVDHQIAVGVERQLARAVDPQAHAPQIRIGVGIEVPLEALAAEVPDEIDAGVQAARHDAPAKRYAARPAGGIGADEVVRDSGRALGAGEGGAALGSGEAQPDPDGGDGPCGRGPPGAEARLGPRRSRGEREERPGPAEPHLEAGAAAEELRLGVELPAVALERRQCLRVVGGEVVAAQLGRHGRHGRHGIAIRGRGQRGKEAG